MFLVKNSSRPAEGQSIHLLDLHLAVTARDPPHGNAPFPQDMHGALSFRINHVAKLHQLIFKLILVIERYTALRYL